MISAQSSGPTHGTRLGSRLPWLLATGLVAACSLLAPNDEHYLRGAAKPSGVVGDGGEAGEGGDDGQGGHTSGDAGAGGVEAPSSAGEGGLAGEAGDSTGGEPPAPCTGNLADCNQEADDGCEVDLSSSPANCGGCGEAFACAADEACERGACVSISGCSDGTREAFSPMSRWPHLAGCTAQWPRSSLRAPKTGNACGFELGVCEVPADACGAGWHVCAIPPFGPAEVSERATAEECAAQTGAFAAAVGDQSCEPCTAAGDGAACCGQGCVQQNGKCIYPGMTAWFGVINQYKNVCGAIESSLIARGVLCCRAP